MDGIDGIAGGVALAGALGWLMLSANMHNAFVFWIALAIAAGSLGFLGHNWSPAKIFMGDVASTFLGYTFAVLPLLAATRGGDALMLGTLLMWTFIMDAGITFLQRLLRGEKLLYGHRSHVYQLFVIGGYSHAAVSTLYILLTLFASLLSYAWSWGQAYAPPIIILGLPLIWILIARYANSLNTKDTRVTKV
jgi:UDP-N-acetylmuramyl pentapeptide phosphotransferase/UDP-N-acetylglucosamine-1-phosphate transferase